MNFSLFYSPPPPTPFFLLQNINSFITLLLDIFAYNIEPITKKYLNELDCQQIQVFEDGINYFKIPQISKRPQKTSSM
mgnify:CR=1 FL=1